MAFGAELKDFVSGFQAGYKMFDSKEEKEEKRELRQMRKENHERQGKWGEEDRAYRRERDGVEDSRWGTTREDNLRQQGAVQGRWETDQEYRNRALELERDKVKLGVAKETGETGRMGDYLDTQNSYRGDGGDGGSARPSAIPDEDGPQASLQQSSGNGNAAPNEWIRYANASATRNKPLSPKLESAVTQVASDLGVQVEVFSGGQSGSRRTGSVRHDHGDAADVFFYKDGKKLDWANPKDRPIFEEIVKRGKSAGLTGFGAGPGYMQAGSMHMGYGAPSVWGAGGKSASAPDWLKNAYSGTQQTAQNFARGGAVEAIPSDDPEELTGPQEASGLFTIALDEDEPTQVASTVLPEEGPVPARRPSYEGVSEGNKEEPTKDPWEQGRRAVRDGLKQAISNTGADKDSAIADPELEKVRQQYIRGYGAAPAQMMRQVIDKIDPERKMPSGERNIKAMGTVYQYYLDQGEFDKAKEAAASMVQYYRQTSQQFLALGQAAAEKGDIDKAAKAMIAAYANVPNGRDMNVEKKDGNYVVTVTDAKTGKQVNRTVASPRDIAAQAMNFNPATFDDEILSAAGAPAEKYDDPSIENMGKVESDVRSYVEENLAQSGLPDKAISAIQDVATSISSTKENRMGPEQATRFAAALSAFDSSDPSNDKANFSAKPVRGNPDRIQVTMNGQTAVISKGQFNNLTGLRGEMEKERKATRDTDKATAEKRAQQFDYLKKGVEAFGGAMNDASNQMLDNQGAAKAGADMGAMGGKLLRERRGVIPDEAASPSAEDQEAIATLLEARQKALARPDPERYGLREIEARLKQLGWQEKE